MIERRRTLLPAGLMLAGLILIAAYLLAREKRLTAGPDSLTGVDLAEPANMEPILPTRTLVGNRLEGEASASRSADPSPPTSAPFPAIASASPTSFQLAVGDASSWTTVTRAPLSTLTALPTLSRFGVSGRLSDVAPARAAGLVFGSFYNWDIVTTRIELPGISFWQTIRVSEDGFETAWADIAAAAAANPGAVWLIGNEPDVIWQDNVTPARYAALYHQAYTFIKSQDPSSQIAIGAVSMPTPLRRAYLDRVLQAYYAQVGRPMPIDIWNIHAYILREESGSWGVDIPPGLDDASDLGRLIELQEHDDIEIFKQYIVDFREWMDARGYGGYPLAVTEFGVLMPPDYGFPPEANGRFMREAVEFMLSAAGPSGYAADGGKLVQWWFWYSLVDTAGPYGAGDLYDPTSGQITYLGHIWTDLVREH